MQQLQEDIEPFIICTVFTLVFILYLYFVLEIKRPNNQSCLLKLFYKIFSVWAFWIFHWSKTEKKPVLDQWKVCSISTAQAEKKSWNKLRENKICGLVVWCTNKIYIYFLYSCSNRLVVRHKTTPIDNFVPNYDWELI